MIGAGNCWTLTRTCTRLFQSQIWFRSWKLFEFKLRHVDYVLDFSTSYCTFKCM